MFFSIIVPVYNIELYIGRCISSILRQSYKDFELIIVDDGSQDESMEIINQKFSDNRLKIFAKPNGGLSSARNYGLNVAKAKYVFFIDGDDYLSDIDALNKIKSEVINESEILDILIFNNKVVFESDDREGWENINAPEKSKILTGKEYIQHYQHMPFNAWTQCYRLEFLKENDLFFKEGIYFEDIYFNLDAYKIAMRVKGINEFLLNYVKRENSIMTQKYNLKHLYSELEVLQKMSYFFKHNLIDKSYLANRMDYEYSFFKRIYKQITKIDIPDHKKLSNYYKKINIPITSSDLLFKRLQKTIFNKKPSFILNHVNKLSILERIENKIFSIICRHKKGR